MSSEYEVGGVFVGEMVGYFEVWVIEFEIKVSFVEDLVE